MRQRITTLHCPRCGFGVECGSIGGDDECPSCHTPIQGKTCHSCHQRMATRSVVDGFCPLCHALVADADPPCSIHFPPSAAPALVPCGSCSRPIAEGGMHCPYCGAKQWRRWGGALVAGCGMPLLLWFLAGWLIQVFPPGDLKVLIPGMAYLLFGISLLVLPVGLWRLFKTPRLIPPRGPEPPTST